MKKSFLLENGAPFLPSQPCASINQPFVFTVLAILFSLFTHANAYSCELKLTVKGDKMIFTPSNTSGSAADTYTWTITGGIDASGSGGTGAAPIAAEIVLANNTYSLFTWKVNGSACFSSMVRVKYTCESPGYKVITDPINCSANFKPYANPASVVAHTWNFGDATSESNLSNPVHSYNDPGGVFSTTHTTVEWSGQEYTIDRCTVSVGLDCTPLPPNVSGTTDVAAEPAIKVFPNPAGDWVQIEATNFTTPPVRARFYSITGAVVIEESWPEDQTNTNIDVSRLQAGHYVMEIICGDGNRKTMKVDKN